MPLSASSSGMALFPRHVSKRPRFESTTVFTPNKRDIRMDVSFIWWGKVDSNHRRHCQQIYSLSHLATLEFPHIQLCWSWWTDSNPDLLITNVGRSINALISGTFRSFRVGGSAVYKPAASIQYMRSCSRLGHGLGQTRPIYKIDFSKKSTSV